MKQSRHAILDKKTIKLMEDINVKPRKCFYCDGEYYPYKTDTKEIFEGRLFCSSICKGNYNAKTI